MATEPPPHRLFRFRFLFLLGYFVLWGAAVYAVCGNDALFGGKFDYGVLVIAAWVILILQLLFLAGAPHLRPRRLEGGRPMLVSVAVGALVAALVSGGIIATLCSLLHFDNLGNRVSSPWILVILLLVTWLGWLGIFAAFLAGEWADRYRKLYRFLLAGTVLELLITIPVDISVRRRSQCYCGEGTFLALLIGIPSLLWVLGPGVVLLFLARRMQRRERFGYCRRCGYDLRMLSSTRCPECGTPFEVIRPAQVPAS